MASDVMSLFGLDPAQIRSGRVRKGADRASGMSKDFAIGYAGGSQMGQGIASAFGFEDPEIQQAQAVQDSLRGANLSTPDGMRQAASKLMQAGQYPQAMALYERARVATPAAKANNLTSTKPYTMMVDGVEKQVQGGIYNNTPSYYAGADVGYLPLPADAYETQPVSGEGVSTAATSSGVDMARTLMQNGELIDNSLYPNLDQGQSDAMAEWIANTAKELNKKYSGQDYPAAQAEAYQLALQGIKQDTSLVGSDVGGSITWAPPVSGAVPVISDSAASYLKPE